MVLPHRIELWTSPLPRRCSTTELRQRNRWFGRCHTGLSAQGKASTCATVGPADNGVMTRVSEDDRKAKKASRLAAALRENLRRRKAQERQRGAPSSPSHSPKPTKTV